MKLNLFTHPEKEIMTNHFCVVAKKLQGIVQEVLGNQTWLEGDFTHHGKA